MVRYIVLTYVIGTLLLFFAWGVVDLVTREDFTVLGDHGIREAFYIDSSY